MLYNTCDDTTQHSIINTVPDFLTLPEPQLLDAIEQIVTTRSNPTVHRMHFTAISQHENESLKDYLVRLKSTAQDCEFACPHCNLDLSPTHIRDQFIRGLNNETLQVDVLAKASQLTTLEDILKHAEAFETALRDHAQLQDTSDVMAAHGPITRNKRELPSPNTHLYVQDAGVTTIPAERGLQNAQLGGKSVKAVIPQIILPEYAERNHSELQKSWKRLILLEP